MEIGKNPCNCPTPKLDALKTICLRCNGYNIDKKVKQVKEKIKNG